MEENHKEKEKWQKEFEENLKLFEEEKIQFQKLKEFNESEIKIKRINRKCFEINPRLK